MGVLDKLKSRLGPSQTDHKRLAEIKLTQERLKNKPTNTHTTYDGQIPKTAIKARTGGGSMDLIGGKNLVKTAKGVKKMAEIVMNAMQGYDTKRGPSQLESKTDLYTKQRNGRLKEVFEENTTDTDLVTGETSKQYIRQKTKTNRKGKKKTKLKKVFETYDSDGNLISREKTKKKNK